MSQLPGAYYVADGESFRPTELTIGPWDPRFQHGGPPSALLGRAIEQYASGFVSRITIELLRPIPLAPLRVEVESLRVGRAVQWLEASLIAEEQTVAVARAIAMQSVPLVIEEPNSRPLPAPPMPTDEPMFQFPFFTREVAYHRSIDVRLVEGQWGQGPVTVWVRFACELVSGEPMSGMQRTLAIADASSGIALALPIERYTFVNPDLTVHVQRHPEGEWIGLSARSVPQQSGVGLVQSTLYDPQGEIGRSLQSLVVRARN